MGHHLPIAALIGVGSDADRRSPNSAKGWTMAPLMDSAGDSAVISGPRLIVVAVKP